MVMVPEQVVQRRLTFEDYQSLPDDQDYEIIEGRLYVAPRRVPRHQVVALELSAILLQHVAHRGLGLVVPDADLIIRGRDIYVSPDIMVFLGERAASVPDAEQIETVPDLIVEVLSPSTQGYDRSTKRRTYEDLGVPHYWMVNPRTRALTECVLGPAGRYRERTISAPGPFGPMLFPDLEIDLARLFR